MVNHNLPSVIQETDNNKINTNNSLNNSNNSNNLNNSNQDTDSMYAKGIKLIICFIGLQLAYITWGILQERMMTTEYPNTNKPFPSATFAVAANRSLALIVAFSIITYQKTKKRNQRLNKREINNEPPFFYYSPSSISNVLSSFAQYQALRYVSFPLQVLSKSSKIIPVMLVGKFLHKKTYPWIDYLEAIAISVGVGIFMLNEKSDPKESSTTATDDDIEDTIKYWGYCFLLMYIVCDAFTSQWQDKIFKSPKWKVDQFQMMFGVNFFSLLFTTFSLVTTGELFVCLRFFADEPMSLSHIITLSICSAVGQLFIFYTIKKFGPIIFTIIMTTRQMLSMVISCLLFDHPLGFISLFGAIIVFITLGHRTHRRWKASNRR